MQSLDLFCMVGSTPKPLSSLAQVLCYSLRAQMSWGPYRALWVFGTTLSMQKIHETKDNSLNTQNFVNTDKWYCEALLLGALPKPSGHSHGQPAWAGGLDQVVPGGSRGSFQPQPCCNSVCNLCWEQTLSLLTLALMLQQGRYQQEPGFIRSPSISVLGHLSQC